MDFERIKAGLERFVPRLQFFDLLLLFLERFDHAADEVHSRVRSPGVIAFTRNTRKLQLTHRVYVFGAAASEARSYQRSVAAEQCSNYRNTGRPSHAPSEQP